MIMKKYLTLLITLKVSSMFAQLELSIPEAPIKIEFANVIINLDENARQAVNNEINGLLTPPNSFLDEKLERMQWYFPIIEDILDQEDIPEDLKYLAIMESSLLPDALSTSSAVGFWQFKEATGKEMGLRIDNDIDERKYIIASTRAASLYLKRNNLIFKNWISTIYSYNQGATGAAKMIPENWSYASEITFDKNTPEYLIRALANRIAFEHRLNRLRNSPRKFVLYPTRSKSLAEIAVELTTDIAELRKYNSWLYAAAIPAEKDYIVLIPARLEDVDELESKIAKRRDLVRTDLGFPELKRVTMVSTSDSDPVYYEINNKKGILAQPGDEAAQVAAKAKINLTTFLKINDLSDRDLIKTGQVYYLQKKAKKAKVAFHTASGQQTMWDISQMYGVTLKELLHKNRMDNVQRLQPGRVVWMQKRRPKNKPVEIIQEVIEQPTPQPSVPVRENYETRKEPEIKEPAKIEPEFKDPVVSTKPVVKPEVEKTREPEFKTQPTEKRKVEIRDNEVATVKSSSSPEIKTTPSAPKNNSTPAKTKITETAIHKVKKGETLFSIAKNYDLTVAQLRNMNNMGTNDVLKSGQNLKVTKSSMVPSSDVEKVLAQKKEPDNPVVINTPAKTSKTQTHTVTSGETVFSISKKYNVSTVEIIRWNNLKNNNIYVGQKILIESDAAKAAIESTKSGVSRTHVIKKGETLFSISKKYGVSVTELKAWNNIRDNEIQAGRILEIR